MMQFVLGIKVAGQLLVWVKVPSAGEILMVLMLTAAVPSLYRVMLMVLLVPGVRPGKVRGLGNRVMALVAPMPVSVIFCVGLPGELSLRVTDPLPVPAAVGLKLTVMVQFWPALNGVGVVGQVLLSR